MKYMVFSDGNRYNRDKEIVILSSEGGIPMTTHKIITIGRQFGSGGHEIGNLLATRLDIPLYDNNLVRMAAEKMDIREETAKAIDETSLNSFVSSYLITPMGYSSYINSEEYVQPLSEQMYELQTEIIKKLAERGPCVIVGRCADYVLKDNPNVVSVFVHADEKFCLDRAMERNSMTEKEMKKYIEKTDKFRGDFYRYHTGHEWADARNYDLCLNSGKLGFQKCVEEIKAYIKIRFDL